MCSAAFFHVLLVCLVRAFCLTMYVVFGCFVRLLLFMFSSFVLCGVLFVCLVQGVGSVAFGHVLFGCFVQAFRPDVQALYPLLASGCFIGVFCSDALFESSVLCFVRVFCWGGGACFAR